jgi:hypothetical protein
MPGQPGRHNLCRLAHSISWVSHARLQRFAMRWAAPPARQAQPLWVRPTVARRGHRSR